MSVEILYRSRDKREIRWALSEGYERVSFLKRCDHCNRWVAGWKQPLYFHGLEGVGYCERCLIDLYALHRYRFKGRAD